MFSASFLIDPIAFKLLCHIYYLTDLVAQRKLKITRLWTFAFRSVFQLTSRRTLHYIPLFISWENAWMTKDSTKDVFASCSRRYTIGLYLIDIFMYLYILFYFLCLHYIFFPISQIGVKVTSKKCGLKWSSRNKKVLSLGLAHLYLLFRSAIRCASIFRIPWQRRHLLCGIGRLESLDSFKYFTVIFL